MNPGNSNCRKWSPVRGDWDSQKSAEPRDETGRIRMRGAVNDALNHRACQELLHLLNCGWCQFPLNALGSLDDGFDLGKGFLRSSQ